MHKLPLELQDLVVDSLRGDRPALLLCMRVCRAWHLRARYNLFHTLHIDWDGLERTYLLFDALAAHHALVRHLTLSRRAGFAPALLLELLEALDLRSLTIRAHGGPQDIQPVLLQTAQDPALGERLLFAIADMPHLHTLAFAPATLAYSLALRKPFPCPGALDARGLHALHTLTDDLFPPVRAHAFWVALAQAKARPGAAPLRHLGTRLGSMGCGALARLLTSCGAGLRTLRLDTRGPHLYEDGTAADLHAAALTLAPCTALHTLDLTLQAVPADFAAVGWCAALLATANQTPLAHVVLTATQVFSALLVRSDIARGLGALDASLAALPRLRSVAWRVRGAREGDECLEDALQTALPRLAERKGVDVSVDSV